MGTTVIPFTRLVEQLEDALETHFGPILASTLSNENRMMLIEYCLDHIVYKMSAYDYEPQTPAELLATFGAPSDVCWTFLHLLRKAVKERIEFFGIRFQEDFDCSYEKIHIREDVYDISITTGLRCKSPDRPLKGMWDDI